MFENDPKLQELQQRVRDSIVTAEQKAQAYCDRYGCIEPDENTMELETFKDMRTKERR